MGTPKMFVLNTHFGLVNMGSVGLFLYRKMVLFGGAFWVFFHAYLLPLFGFIVRNLFRLQDNTSNCLVQESTTTDSNDSKSIEPEPEPEPGYEAKPDRIDIKDSEDDESSKEESPRCFLKFQFRTYEEFSRSYRENGDSLCSNAAPATSTNKYEFTSEKSYSGFSEEPEDVNYIVKELFLDPKDDSSSKKEIFNDGFLSEKDFMEQNSESGTVLEEIQGNSTDGVCKEELSEAVAFTEDLVCDHDVSNEEVQFLSEDFTVDSDSESITSSHEFSVANHLIDSNSEGFLSDRDFGGEFELDTSMDIDGETRKLTKGVQSEKDFDEEDREIIEELQRLEETHIGLVAKDSIEEDREIMKELQKLEETHIGLKANDFNEVDNDIMEELLKLETESPDRLNTEFLSEKDFNGDNDVKNQQQEFGGEPNSQNLSKWEEPEDSQGLETLWEHQELIEQLKMELRKVRATGLPTILEESESPKIMEDLQPWKIDEKFQHEDTMSELHKFYKSYRERMRKFDILNYQKMYALGFLQSKDPLQSVSSGKSSVPANKSILLENFWLWKPKKAESDPTVKFVRELHSDLEMVYVGQMCLSWEFLYWQYEKALELWESDPHGIHGYNEVAGEFQQFQVLLQRFIENEPFQGPRVQNYVKNRCVIRNLLQVPVIREDNMKDKKKARRRGRDESAITSDMLVEIMEESIRIIWRFVRADKHEVNTILKGLKGTQIELQDPADSELLTKVRTTLQKKEKKLKDLLRTGNCILKRFQKNREDSSDQVLYFFSQVDMKLVSRVLNMSRITTEQLVWCHHKLSRINFVNRKIHVEPSFLLFPC